MSTFMQNEIREQPDVLRRFASAEAAHVQDIARALGHAPIDNVVIAARGTSYNAAIYGRYLLENLVGWPVSLAAPSLYTLYRRPPRLRNALVMGISQSGQGADVVEVVGEARKQGATTVAITNTAASPLAEAAEHVILCRAGVEQGMAATKTYTSQLYALAWLGAALTEDASRFDALRVLPDQMARVLDLEETVRTGAERYRYAERCVVVGRGFNYATALEIALKLRELTYVGVEPYSAADFRHGSIAVVEPGFPALLIAPSGATVADLQTLAADLRDRHAELLVMSDQPDLLQMARFSLCLPPTIPEWVSPLLYVVPGQLLACYLALAKGQDPDHPRTLRKVIITL